MVAEPLILEDLARVMREAFSSDCPASESERELGAKLIQKGYLTESQLRECIGECSKDLRLEHLLLMRGVINVRQLLEVLGENPPPPCKANSRAPTFASGSFSSRGSSAVEAWGPSTKPKTSNSEGRSH